MNDVCLVNPFGVRSKTHMIYYTIAEIPQEYRSKLSSIFLLACVKTNHFKKIWFEVDISRFYNGDEKIGKSWHLH